MNAFLLALKKIKLPLHIFMQKYFHREWINFLEGR